MVSFTGCKKQSVSFNFILHDACIISNTKADNSIEGKHYRIASIENNKISLDQKLPEKLMSGSWYMGWGKHTNYYNAGVENLLLVSTINKNQNQIVTGRLIRGAGKPNVGDEIIFLNAHPNGFKNFGDKNCINTWWWKSFPTNSTGFSNIVYDSKAGYWVMIVNSYDGANYSFLAKSLNLIDWEPLTQKHFIDATYFKDLDWAGYNLTGEKDGSALISEVIRINNLWYIFFDSWGVDGKRSIGVTAKYNLEDTNLVLSPTLALAPGGQSRWDAQSSSYAKILKFHNLYLMFYDGQSPTGIENVGLAVSNDLIHWQKSGSNPVIEDHYGWRSADYTSEPVYVTQSNDSIFLVITGAKGWNENILCRYIKRDCYKRQKGNVDDIQWGVYISTDQGKTFTAHANNPVFINDYGNPWENEHLGASMEYIKTDTAEFLFYQAKTSYPESKYNIRFKLR